MLRDKDGKLSMARTWLAGALTGLIEAVLVVTPVETMKTVLVADTNSAKPRFNGLAHGISTIVKEEGIAGIYKGVMPTIAKQMGNQSIRFTTYEFLKKAIIARNPGQPVPAWQMLLCGGTAGFVSVLLTWVLLASIAPGLLHFSNHSSPSSGRHFLMRMYLCLPQVRR